jgi:hypothetical protein
MIKVLYLISNKQINIDSSLHFHVLTFPTSTGVLKHSQIIYYMKLHYEFSVILVPYHLNMEKFCVILHKCSPSTN